MNTIYEDAVFHPHSLRNLETPNSLCASESESSEDQTKIENTENTKEDNITTKQGDEQDIIDRSDTNNSSSAFKTNGIFRPVKSPNFLPLKKENGENGHVTSQNSLVIDPTQLRPHKVILVGNSGVGKSSLMMRLCDNVWSDTVQQSIGVDFRSKMMMVEGQEETMQVWDTAGQERFRSLTQSYFRRVDAIVLVYDITNEDTFLQLQDWVVCIRAAGQMAAPMAVIGNKVDLEDSRAVISDIAAEFADFYRADFAEVSAKEGRNVEDLGYKLLRRMVERRNNQECGEDSDVNFICNSSPPAKIATDNKCCVII